MNEPEEGIAPTDSRLRPDQRLMEDGRWDEANAEKLRLEEKQRAVRRAREHDAEKAAAQGKFISSDCENQALLLMESRVSPQDYLTRHTNRCGSQRSRIRTRTAVVIFIMANIGIIKAEVTGCDVQTYFSSLYS